MGIVQYVADNIGVSKEQAEIGVSLLLKFAKSKLGDNFESVAKFIPGASEIIEKAPSSGGLGGMLGGLASSLTGGGSGGLAELAVGFAESGLSAEKVPEAASAVMNYIGEQGDDNAKSLLADVLK